MRGRWEGVRVQELLRGRDCDAEVECECKRQADKGNKVGEMHFGDCEKTVMTAWSWRRKLGVKFVIPC